MDTISIDDEESNIEVKIMAKQSESLEMNKNDWVKVGKGLLIALGGTALTYITDIIPTIEWGEYKPIVVAISSVLINLGWKYIKGKNTK